MHVDNSCRLLSVLLQRDRQRVEEALQRAAVVFRVAAHVGGVQRLLPLAALHAHAPGAPVLDAALHRRLVAQGVVLTGEEERRRGDGAVVENQDAVVVEVRRVRAEEPEVQHGGVLDEALEARHQRLCQTWNTTTTSSFRERFSPN